MAYDRLLGDHTPTDAMKFGTAFHAYLLNTSEVVCLDEGRPSKTKPTKHGVKRKRRWATSSYPTRICSCSNA